MPVGKQPVMPHKQRGRIMQGVRLMRWNRWIGRGAALLMMGWSGIAAAQDTLADPAGSGVIVSAVRWLEGTLLGTIATVVAVIAVASVGLLMLTGRINWRYGATVILGCFILFGAASIVAGIQSTAQLGQ
jgi:type IV secretion system protein VirB2